MPPRYFGAKSLLESLQARALPLLQQDQTILDIGAGRLPTIPRNERPGDVRYVGLDIAPEELGAADEDAYDETVVSNITKSDGRLVGRFDVAMSCHVLEHVESLSAALENIRLYLRPGGRLVSLFACTFSAHAMANRLLPEGIGVRLLDRPPESKFVAVYDHCWPAALRSTMVSWSDVEVVPLFLGAHYFARWSLLQRAFLRFENWSERHGHDRFASHLILLARR